jgi:hypothetical protein
VEDELRTFARMDPDRCCGYFPALAGRDGIISDLPACQAFASRIPEIRLAGRRFQFNFLRLSLVQQSTQASFHLDSDAATALTGEVAEIGRRVILRLLLNLSADRDRSLHYMDVNPGSVELAVDGSYARAADLSGLGAYARIARIPRRRESTVLGVVFASNRVLHSGVDDERGHFVAGYGIEIDASDAAPFGPKLSNAPSTPSRSSA